MSASNGVNHSKEDAVRFFIENKEDKSSCAQDCPVIAPKDKSFKVIFLYYWISIMLLKMRSSTLKTVKIRPRHNKRT